MASMSNQSLKAPKAARRKVTTDLGRQIMQRERQRLIREQAALGEQLAAEAQRRLHQQNINRKQVKPEQIAVERGLIKRLGAVLASERVEARIIARPSAEVSAWTDFEQIVVNYRLHDDVRLLAATVRGLIYHEGGHCRFTLPFAQLVEMVLGKYTPADHNQYHKAWNVLEDQRMETAVVSDSPRKAAYFTPMVMTELAQDVNAAAANWPILIWRRYLPAKVRNGARKLFVAKHNLMGLDGEAIAKRWERAVTKYVLADTAPRMWEAILEAHELLKLSVVPAAEGDLGHQQQMRERKDADSLEDALVIPISPDMIDTDTDVWDDDDEAELPEIDTTDPEVAEHLGRIIVAIFNHPETLLRVVYSVPVASDAKSEGSGSSSSPIDSDEGDAEGESESDEDDAESEDDDEDATGTHGGSKADQDDESDEGDDDSDEADGSSKADDEGDEDDADEDADGSYDDEDDDEADKYANDGDRESGKDPEREGGIDGAHDEDAEVEDDLDYRNRDDEDDEELTDEDLQNALDEAEAERDADEALDGDVRAFTDAVDTRVSDLMPYQTHPSNDYEATAAAHNLADDLEQSFQAATVDTSPQWVEQQRRGVVNVLRYITRQPGEVEVFRQWADDKAPGYDIAVSLLLDYSGSMGGYTRELAQAAYGTKLACEKLEIPCTVTLWDTDAMVLWDANEQAEFLPVIESAGGTDPQRALADLRNQRYEKVQHVVIIMTDGEWNGHQNSPGFLAAYREDGRIMIGVGFNSGYGTADHLADKLRRYGCDESYAVKSLMEIPRLLEQTLVALV